MTHLFAYAHAARPREPMPRHSVANLQQSLLRRPAGALSDAATHAARRVLSINGIEGFFQIGAGSLSGIGSHALGQR